MLTTEDVRRLIEEAIPGAEAAVQDMTGTSDHFAIQVVGEAFRDKTRIEQHKMVHAALGEHLTTTIHAIDLKIRVPE